MAKKRPTKGKFDSKVAINQMKVDALPYSYYSAASAIIPYGTDNLYPNRITKVVRKSPTAKGCIKRTSEFIFGQGLALGGDMIVNRDGDTLNNVIGQAVKNYSEMNGFALHLNFNVFGQISEMFAVDLKYIRKSKNLKTAQYGLWEKNNRGATYLGSDFVEVDLYGEVDPEKAIEEEGLLNYKGQIYYFSKDFQIYPDSPLDSASISASFEKEVQVYQYATINNGFSGSGVLKVPVRGQGEQTDKNIDAAKDNLASIHGADRAGSFITMPIPVDMDGKFQTTNLFESFTPNNIDTLFVNQNKKAEEDILKTYTMPKILLGVSDSGMFNQASFNDAFNYKNADTEGDRKIIEKEFEKILDDSIFPLETVELVPLEMKGDQSETTATVTVEQEQVNTGNETLRSLTGKQKAQMLREIDKYKNGKINRKQLDVFLRSYGLSQEEIEEMIAEEIDENEL